MNTALLATIIGVYFAIGRIAASNSTLVKQEGTSSLEGQPLGAAGAAHTAPPGDSNETLERDGATDGTDEKQEPGYIDTSRVDADEEYPSGTLKAKALAAFDPTEKYEEPAPPSVPQDVTSSVHFDSLQAKQTEGKKDDVFDSLYLQMLIDRLDEIPKCMHFYDCGGLGDESLFTAYYNPQDLGQIPSGLDISSLNIPLPQDRSLAGTAGNDYGFFNLDSIVSSYPGSCLPHTRPAEEGSFFDTQETVVSFDPSLGSPSTRGSSLTDGGNISRMPRSASGHVPLYSLSSGANAYVGKKAK